MVYIVENNGVYGLTKGQFSATADRGSKSKGAASSAPTILSIWWAMALQLGASFVARSFRATSISWFRSSRRRDRA